MPFLHTENEMEKGRFSSPVGTHKGHPLTGADCKGYPLEDIRLGAGITKP
jgi:hypothetical protein